MPEGSFVGDIAKDLGIEISRLISGKARVVTKGGRQYVDLSRDKGTLVVKERIDREELCKQTTPCSFSFDLIIENPIQLHRVTVEVQDINDNAPIFPRDKVNLEISENASPARDGGSPPLSSEVKVTVVVQDQNDNAPQVLYPVQTGGSLVAEIVPRSADVGYLVTKVVAVDVDSGQNAWLSYKLQKATDRALFEVGPQNGEIRTVRQVTDKDAVKQKLTVVVEDNGQPSRSAVVNINVAVADSFPEVLSEFTNFTHEKEYNDNLTFYLVLALSAVSFLFITCLVVIISVKIYRWRQSRIFFQSSLPVIPYYPPGYSDTGVTGTLPHMYNYDVCMTTDSRKSDCQYSTLGGDNILVVHPSFTETVQHTMNKRNLFKDQESPEVIRYSVPEELKKGSVIGNIAHDLGLDVKRMRAGRARIVSEENVNADSGVVYAVRSFDYEQMKNVRISVRAQDGGSPPLSTNVTLDIIIQDQNDNAPQVLYPVQTGGSLVAEIVPRSADVGYLVTKVVAVDVDSGQNAWLSYKLQKATDRALFEVGPQNGEIRTVRQVTDKDAVKQKLTVVVEDNGQPSRSAVVNINVAVADSFPEVLSEFTDFTHEKEYNDNLTFYLVLALSAVSFLFITCLVVIISVKIYRWRQYRIIYKSHLPVIPYYPPGYTDTGVTGTLPHMYNYDVCMTTDSRKSDCKFSTLGGKNVLLVDAGFTETMQHAINENNYSDNGVSPEPVLDINDHAPLFHKDEVKFKISESAALGARFVLDAAEDPDVGVNALQNYQLNPNDNFVLKQHARPDGVQYAEMVLQKPLDREQNPHLSLIFTAVDGGNPQRIGTTRIDVTVLDANDNAPVFNQSVYRAKVEENAPKGTYIITVNATDADIGSYGQIRYTFSNLKGNMGDVFSLDENSGIVSVIGVIDFEKNKVFEIGVEAEDQGGLADFSKVVVEVIDANDNAPVVTVMSLSSHISEDVPIGTTVAVLNVKDPDSELNENNAPGLSICRVMANDIDSNQNARISFILEESQINGSPVSSYISVNTETDQNDNAPQVLYPVQTGGSLMSEIVPRSADVGYLVTKVVAVDVDSGQNAWLSYKLQKATDRALFEVGPQNGEIRTVRQVTDKDAVKRKLTVVVEDNGQPSRSAVVNINVAVADSFPEVLSEFNDFMHEKQYNDKLTFYLVLALAAVSFLFISCLIVIISVKIYRWRQSRIFFQSNLPVIPYYPPGYTDTGVTGTLPHMYNYDVCMTTDSRKSDCKYSTLGGHSVLVVDPSFTETMQHAIQERQSLEDLESPELFYIRNLPFRIRTEQELDREREAEYNITVTCSDEGVPSLSSSASLRLQISDVNDNAPVFERNNYEAYVVENNTPGLSIFTVKASDVDSNQNARVSYILEDSTVNGVPVSSYVTVSADSGIITAVRSFDYEQLKDFHFHVKAQDGGSPPLSSNVTVKIAIQDQNDNAPQVLYPVQTGGSLVAEIVPRSADVGYLVTKVVAVDVDSGQNAWLSYKLQKATDRALFEVGPQNGEIRTVRQVTDKDAVKQKLTVVVEDNGQPSRSAVVNINVAVADSFPEVLSEFTDFTHEKHVRTEQELDREREAEYNITVTCSDEGVPSLSSSASLRLQISDVNDNAPVFERNNYEAYVVENNTPGLSIFTVKASDVDSNQNARVSYILEDSTVNGVPVSSYVTVSADSGVINAVRSFDYEQLKDFHFRVKAQDGGSPPLSTNVTVKITIQDQNDNAPQFLYPVQTGGSLVAEIVPRSADVGYLVTKVVAVDVDSGQNAWLSYKLQKTTDRALFEVGPQNGEIRTVRQVTDKDAVKQKLTVVVEDNGQPSRSAVVNIKVAVADSFPEVLSEFTDFTNEKQYNDNLTFYLVLALAAVSLLFITSVVVILSVKIYRWRQSRIFQQSNLPVIPYYPPGYTDTGVTGTLPHKYNYDVCMTTDSRKSDCKYSTLGGHNILVVDQSFTETMKRTSDENYFLEDPDSPELISYSIPEEMAKGSIIGNIAQDLGLDLKRLKLGKARAFSGDVKEYIELNRENGLLLIKENIDRESLCGKITPCAQHLQMILENPMELYSVTVEITDVNDNAPTFQKNEIRFEISESAAPGARFVLGRAVDLDVGINGLRSYSLNPTEQELDREREAEYNITVTCSDEGVPSLSSSASLRLQISDVNDNAPVFERNNYEAYVVENNTPGLSIFTVKASDVDSNQNARVSYILEDSTVNGVPVSSYVTVSADSGVINAVRSFDYEQLKDFHFRVKAQDGGSPPLSSNVTVKIAIQDQNDNVPQVLYPVQTGSSLMAELVPRSADVGYLVTKVVAVDVDSGQNAWLSYKLQKATDRALFEVGPQNGEIRTVRQVTDKDAVKQKLTVVVEDNGQPSRSAVVNINVAVADSFPEVLSEFTDFTHEKHVRTEQELDREREAEYNITVTCSDEGVPSLSSSASLRLQISDVNDNAPVFERNNYEAYVVENNTPGLSIFTVKASDVDSNQNARVSYILEDSTVNGVPVSSYVTVSADSGVINAVRSFDYEQLKDFHFRVKAQDGGSPPLSTNVTVKITIQDQNDNAPQVLYPVQTDGSLVAEIVPRSADVGYLVTKVVAVDVDSGQNAWLSYKLQKATDRALFEVGPQNGEIRTVRQVTDKDAVKQKLTVVVEDNGQPSRSAVVNINVAVADSFPEMLSEFTNFTHDVNDNKPTIDILSMSSSISEESKPNTVVAMIKVNDPDSEQELDREREAEYNITVTCSDEGVPSLSSSASLRLQISDVNDNAPVFERNNYEAYVVENNTPGLSIFTVKASDVDSNQNARVSYILEDSTVNGVPVSSYVTVSADSGVINAVRSFDYEQLKDFHFRVKVQDGGSPPLSSNVTVKITIQDQNDNAPQILYPVQTGGSLMAEIVPRSADVGYLVTKVVAVDVDSGQNAWLSYKLQKATDRALFEVGPQNGEIRTVRQVTDKDAVKQKLTVVVEDNGQPSRSAVVNINVAVADSFPEVLSEFTDFTHVKIYRWRQSRIFHHSNLPVIPYYPPGYADTGVTGTLPHMYNYDVCMTTDSRKSDCKYSTLGGQKVVIMDRSFTETMQHVKTENNFLEDPNSPELMVLENPMELYSITIEVTDINDNAPTFQKSEISVRTEQELDREREAEYNITVTCSDEGVPSLSSSASLRLQISDVNDNAPVFQRNNYEAYVVENNTPGLSIFTVKASDVDSNQNARVSYILEDSTVNGVPVSSYVTVSADSGVINAVRSFDYEQLKDFHFRVKAQDGGSPPLSTNVTVKITIQDQNDNAPQVLYPVQTDGSLVAEIVPRSADVGYLVTKVVAVDVDSGQNAWLSYKLQKATDRALFEMGPQNGEIRTVRQVTDKDAVKQKLTVVVEDNGQPSRSAVVNINIAVADSFPEVLSEFTDFTHVVIISVKIYRWRQSRIFHHSNLPVIPYYPPGYTDTGVTGTLPHMYNYDMCMTTDSRKSDCKYSTLVGQKILIMDRSFTETMQHAKTENNFLEDPDSPDLMVLENPMELYSITIEVTDINDNAPTFQKSEISVRTEKELDREREAEYNITVTCSDEGVPSLSSSASLRLQISDVNDNAPVFQRNNYEAYVVENNTPGLSIFTVKASDVDSNQNARVSYILEDSTVNGVPVSSYVTVSADSGIINAVRSFDYEQLKDFHFHVKAQDGGSPPLSTNVTVKITIQDQNDNVPQVLYPVQTGGSLVAEIVPRSADVGYLVTKVVAVDVDSGQNAWLSYKLQKATDRALFEVGPQNGEIRTVRQVTDKDAVKQKLTVVVEDNGQPSRSAVVNINVAVADSFPEVLSEFTDSISEESKPSAVIAMIKVIDPDSGANGHVHCTINDNIPFVIASPSNNFFSVRTNSASLRLQISDVNDNAPVFERNNYEAYVVENNTPGLSIFTVKASDVDSNQNARVSYILEDSTVNGVPVSSYVTVIADSGVINAVRSFDYEQLKDFHVHVKAQDGGSPPLSSNVTVKITIQDQNDNAPQVLYPVQTGGSLVAEIVPRSADVGYLVTKVVAVDVDSGQNAWLSYKLQKATDRALFEVGPQNGEIRTVRQNTHIRFEISESAATGAKFMLEKAMDADVGTNGLQSYSLQPTDHFVLELQSHADGAKKTEYRTSIVENSQKGSKLTTVSAFDADEGSNGLVTNIFSVRSEQELDREREAEYNITVTCSDEGVPSLSSSASLRLQISDVNDNAPVFERNNYEAYVVENNTPGLSIFTVKASDVDSNQNARVSYILEDSTVNGVPVSSYVTVIADSGVINAVRSFDYEQLKDFHVHVKAQDGGSPPLSSNVTVKITIQDQNDNAPQVLYPVQTGGSLVAEIVPRSADVGYLVTKVVAVDVDSGQNAWLSYKLQKATDRALFEVGPQNGEIRTVRQVTDKDAVKQKLTVVVEDNGQPSRSAVVNINVAVADSFPEVLSEFTDFTHEKQYNDNLTFYLVLALAAVSFLFITCLVVIISVKIYRWRQSRIFYQSNLPVIPYYPPGYTDTGVTGTLPHMYHYDVCMTTDSRTSDCKYSTLGGQKVLAMDQSFSETMHHALKEKNLLEDQSSAEMTKKISAAVMRVAVLSFLVLSSHCVLGQLSYSIPEEMAKGSIIGNIAQDLGLDLKRLTSGKARIFSGDSTEYIELSKEKEESPSGTVVGMIKVSDPDASLNGQVQCTISENIPFVILSPSSNIFSVRTEQELDREREAEYNITVTCSDEGVPSLSSSASLRLQISDVNDNAPVFERNNYEAYVVENNTPGLSIFTVKASDVDSNQNARVSYILEDSTVNGVPVSSYVTVSADSGIITAVRSFDYEQLKDFHFHVKAQDGGSPPLSSNVTVKITIQDQNDNVPQVLYPVQTGRSLVAEIVPRSADVGYLVTKVVAVDVDSGQNAWLSYKLQKATDRALFEVGPQNGEIRTVRQVTDKDAVKQKLTVVVEDNGQPSRSAVVNINVAVADSFPEVLSEFTDFTHAKFNNDNLTFSLVLALSAVSLLFITCLVVIISVKIYRWRQSRIFYQSNLPVIPYYPPGYTDTGVTGTLPHMYNYDVCMTTDSRKSDCKYSTLGGQKVIVMDQSFTGTLSHSLKDSNFLEEQDSAGLRAAVYQRNFESACVGLRPTLSYPQYQTRNNFFSIRTEQELDREREAEYNITVTCSDEGVPSLSSSASLRLQISDVNDNAPVFERNNYEAYVVENNTPGLSIFTVKASDVDSNQNARVSYILEDSTVNGVPVSSYVTVSADSGIITAVRSFDYEQLKDFHFRVKAQDGGSPPLSSNVTVKIAIQDQNDNAPQVLYPVQTGGSLVAEIVPRSADVGYLVTKVVAVDVDSGQNAWLSYKLQKATDRALFEVGPQNGEIRTVRQVTDKDAVKQKLTVVVEDNGQPSRSAVVNINVAVADSFPDMLSEFTEFTHGKVYNDDVTFYLILAVRTEQELDREREAEYNITVTCSDEGVPSLSSSASLRLQISDVNDNAPVFERNKYEAYVVENNTPGLSIFTVKASDVDSNQNARVSYILEDSTVNGVPVSSYVTVSADSGVINAVRSFDYEQLKDFHFRVKAQDGGSPPLSSNVTVKITIQDQNDNAPQVLYPVQTGSSLVAEIVPRSADVGYLVTKVVAVDVDSGQNAWLSYKLQKATDRALFEVGPQNGEIRTVRQVTDKDAVKQKLTVVVEDNGQPSRSAVVNINVAVADSFPEVLSEFTEFTHGKVYNDDVTFYLILAIRTEQELDREREAEYNITVTCSDEGVPSLSSSASLRLQISDVNDNAPVFERNNYEAYVVENNTPGLSIFTVKASDVDSNQNARVSYILEDSTVNGVPVSSYVTVSADSGVINAVRSFDYEQLKDFHFRVKAQDGGSPPLSSNVTVKITIQDQNDNVPQVLYPVQTGGSLVAEIVPRSADVGYLVTKVVAVDVDSGQNAWLSYKLQKATDRALFEVGPQNGEIRTVRQVTDKDAVKQKLTVVVEDNGQPSRSAVVNINVAVADSFPEVLSEFTDFSPDKEYNDSMTFYLVLALAAISVLFIFSIIAIISVKIYRWRQKRLFYKCAANLPVIPYYPPGFADGTLPHMYNYEVCGTTDSRISDMKFVRPYSQNTLGSASHMGTVQIEWNQQGDTELLSELVTGQIRYSIPEEMPVGSFVGSLATDLGLEPKRLIAGKARVFAAGGSEYVGLDRENGQLVVKERIDREQMCGEISACSVSFEVILDNPMELYRITVDILDINDNSPVFPKSDITLEINQNDNAPQVLYPVQTGGSLVAEIVPRSADVGYLVTKVVAVDVDSGQNAWLSYKLQKATDRALFEVGPQNGEIRTVRQVTDKDAVKQKLTVVVEDNGQPSRSAVVNINVAVADSFPEVLSEFTDFSPDKEYNDSMTFYLVLALAAISVLFIFSIIAIISVKIYRWRQKRLFYKCAANLPVIPYYPPGFADGTLPHMYNYEVCGTTDSRISDMKFVRPYSQNTLGSASHMGTVQKEWNQQDDTELLSEVSVRT
ncbi:hypothetical protein P4O66_000306 [Electrophorus voltai]|uniref:Cadherin domain-containing protein n=1 Tax=Electrophorus voltai TaxID=2609070 RepID=A0AAD8ZMP7_9TELE|nr:hypothetical protein P4O66_000306 [Electrophorus voltai]